MHFQVDPSRSSCSSVYSRMFWSWSSCSQYIRPCWSRPTGCRRIFSGSSSLTNVLNFRLSSNWHSHRYWETWEEENVWSSAASRRIVPSCGLRRSYLQDAGLALHRHLLVALLLQLPGPRAVQLLTNLQDIRNHFCGEKTALPCVPYKEKQLVPDVETNKHSSP